MQSYLDILADVKTGVVKGNRTGVSTRSKFSVKFRHDMSKGFPLLTTKKVNFKAVAGELFGFLTGQDTVEGFQKFGCNIWNPWGLPHEHYVIRNHTEEELVKLYAEAKDLSITEAEHTLAMADKELSRITAELNDRQNKLALTGDLYEFHEDVQIQELLAKQRETGRKVLLQKAGINSRYKDVIYPKGYLGPIYGKQWLAWRTGMGDIINQLKRLSDQLNTNMYSRRMVLLGWNPEVVPNERYTVVGESMRPVENSADAVEAAILDGKQALPPCHLMTILSVHPPREGSINPTLNLHTTMRSTDVPIGLPFNIASYGLLLELIAHQFGMDAGELVIEMVDCHIYEDQIELTEEQLSRTPKELPTLSLPDDLSVRFDDVDTLTTENLDRVVASLQNYSPEGFIKYPVAV